MLYVYAFVAAPANVPEVHGVDGVSPRSHMLDGFAAVVTEHEGPVDASEENILAHGRVVEALAATNDALLPARFGSMHADKARLREAVGSNLALEEALTRVQGCVELGMRVIAEAAAPTFASSGAAYMRDRLERQHERERVANELHRPLARLARDATFTVGATPRLPLTAAYLVERTNVEAFRRTLDELQAEHPELGIVCTGPWPPYSFAMAEAGPA